MRQYTDLSIPFLYSYASVRNDQKVTYQRLMKPLVVKFNEDFTTVSV